MWILIVVSVKLQMSDLGCHCRHLQSASTKTFQHVKVDALCQPEAVSSVAVPGKHTRAKDTGVHL